MPDRDRITAPPAADLSALGRIEQQLGAYREESARWQGDVTAQLATLGREMGEVKRATGGLSVDVGILKDAREQDLAREDRDQVARTMLANARAAPAAKRGLKWWLTVAAAVIGMLGALRGAALVVEDLAKAIVEAMHAHPPTG